MTDWPQPWSTDHCRGDCESKWRAGYRRVVQAIANIARQSFASQVT